MVSVKMGNPGDPNMGNAYKQRPGNLGSTSSIPGPDESTETFEIDVEGMTAEQARKWVNVQIPYPNLAADDGIAQRAVKYVEEIKRRWEEGTVESREKWRSMQYMLRGGNTLATRFEEHDVHEPEIYKLIEALVPRVEEAILGNDPWVTAHGRTQARQDIADKLVALLMSQLRDDSFEQKVQPSIRAMLEYGFCGIKVHWDIETAKRMVNRVEKLDKQSKRGTRKYRIEKEEKEVVVWNGPRLRLLDPLDMLVDLRSVLPPGDCLWIGDQQWLTLDEIRSAAKIFGYENVDQLEQQTNLSPESGMREFDKQSRSVERFSYRNREVQSQGAPKRILVTELWGMFDPTGGDEAIPCVMTVANDNVCLRVQENFHDDKHVPYAIARASREGWEFLNVGPVDHAVSIQVSVDSHRNLALKGHENHLCPQLFASDTTGLPDSLFDTAPGQVWQVDGPIQWQQAPSTLADYRHMYEIERRSLEEIIGSPRIWEGTAGGDKTATATERKVQEANRRVRSYVLSYSFMMETILRQLHSLNKQFMTEDRTFRVIGKAAKDLGDYTQIGPNEIQQDVEFDFIGLGALRTMDLRATQLQTFMSTMYPYIQMHPGVIDVPEVIREAWDVMVGTSPADKIVKDPGRLDEVLPQDQENYILLQGERVAIHPLDDDRMHLLQMHLDFPRIRDYDFMEKEYGTDATEALLEHRQQHIDALKQKAMRNQAMGQYQPPVVQQPEYDAGRGTTGNRQMAGNPMPADPGGMGNLAGIGGQTPGPGGGLQVGAPDRNTPLTQPQNLGMGA